MTIEQVKQDIQNGKTTLIYYSAHTLWWTHLTSDVEEAMKMGKVVSDNRHDAMLKDPEVPQEHKDKLIALRDMASQGAVEFPMDPTGSPLMQTDDAAKWIEMSEAKPEHFGKHGIETFMKAHHQNSNNICHSEWETYNDMIDNV